MRAFSLASASVVLWKEIKGAHAVKVDRTYCAKLFHTLTYSDHFLSRDHPKRRFDKFISSLCYSSGTSSQTVIKRQVISSFSLISLRTDPTLVLFETTSLKTAAIPLGSNGIEGDGTLRDDCRYSVKALPYR